MGGSNAAKPRARGGAAPDGAPWDIGAAQPRSMELEALGAITGSDSAPGQADQMRRMAEHMAAILPLLENARIHLPCNVVHATRAG